MNSPSFRLAECEAVITQGIRSFYETGKALQEIRENHLYKESDFETFESYCIKKWKFTSEHAYRLMQSYEVIKEMEVSNKTLPIGSVFPTSESQIRPLLKIKDSDERLKAWNEAVKNSEENEKPITAKDVQEVAAKYCEPCDATNCTFRIVSYLTPHFYERFKTLRRGEKEADYLRRVIEAHTQHPELLLPYMKQLTA
jgi:hypothetical protein